MINTTLRGDEDIGWIAHLDEHAGHGHGGLMIGLQHSYNLHLMKSLLLFSWSFMDLSITIVKLILAFGTEK